MRSINSSRVVGRVLAFMGLMVLAWSAPGCAVLGDALVGALAGRAATPTQKSTSADDATQLAREQANRLAGALHHDPAPTGVPTVRWIDDVPGAPVRPAGSAGSNTGVTVGVAEAPGTLNAGGTGTTLRAARPELVEGGTTPGAGPGATPGVGVTTVQPLDRKALVSEVRQMIRDSKDPALTKALSALALNVADPTTPLDPADLSGLDPEKRQLVINYQRLLSSCGPPSVRAGGPPGGAEAPATLANDAGTHTADGSPGAAEPGATPVKIRTALLCKRVHGYGVYDPFETSTFMAGHDQKIIVYLELDHFRSLKDAKGMYQVKLAQEVRLYNDADGLKVWAQAPVDIVDESRNERRDFFVVQLVQLPARLGVGKYILKVRIQDRQANAIDEVGVPINIVADRTLISENAGASR